MSERPFKKGGKMAWLILIVLTSLYILNYMDRMVMSVAMESIKAEFSYSDTQMGMIQGVFLFGVGLITIPAGFIMDRYSRKKTVSLMAFIWSASTLATAFAGRFWSMLAARFVCGAGEAGYAPGGISWISEIFPKRNRSMANGIFMMGIIIGCVLGMAVGGSIITKTGDWRMAFYIFGIPGLFLGLVTLFLPEVRKNVSTGTGDGMLRASLDVLKVNSYFYTTLASGFYLVIAGTVQTWNIVLMMRAYNLNEAEAGMMMGMVIIPTMLTPIIGGIIADRMQKKTPIGRPLFCAIGCLLGIIGYAAEFYFAGIVSVHVFLALMVAGSGLAAMPMPVFNVIGQDVLPESKRGTGAAVILFVQFAVFSWWGSIIVGWISDLMGGGVDGLKYALLSLTPFSLAAAAVYLVCCRYYPADTAMIDQLEGELVA
jgi:MFS family permease